MAEAAAVGGWYAAALYVGVSNKALIGGLGFRFPAALTLLHMAAGGALSAAAVRWWGVAPAQRLKSPAHLRKVAVLAVLFCASVLAGNASLQYIPLSFTQMVGATTPLFTAAVDYLWGGAPQTRRELLALVPVVLGALMTALGEVNFHLLGFTLACCACLCRAGKSVSQGRLLSAEDERLDAVNLMAYMCPISALLLAVFALPREVGSILAWVDDFRRDESRNAQSFLAFLASNVAASYAVNILGFDITRRFGPVALQVLGNGKGAVATVGAVLVFRNPISAVAGVGYGITLLGVGLYGHAKRKGNKAKPRGPPGPSVAGGIVDRQSANAGAPLPMHKHKLSGKDLDKILDAVLVEPSSPGSLSALVPGRAKRRATDPTSSGGG